VTRELHIHGYHPSAEPFGPLAAYGADAEGILDLVRMRPELAEPLHPSLPVNGAQVVWAGRHEMARSVEDVLARRTRALFLNSRAALAMAPAAARLLAAELGRDESWQTEQIEAFGRTAQCYLVPA
jgi:glycerol-3-phosphate dehydrogenase